MKARIRQQVDRCIEELKAGKLTEQSLRRTLEILDETEPKRQDLLYLQANSTSPGAAVVGMLLVQNGQISEGSPDPVDWPYQTVLDAIRDGWRIIKFPELALLLNERRTYGLGCEFILEKWGGSDENIQLRTNAG